jgi:CDP-diglyceride synthetase
MVVEETAVNKTQKGAWYGVLLSCFLAGVVVFDFLDTRVGWPVYFVIVAFVLVPSVGVLIQYGRAENGEEP